MMRKTALLGAAVVLGLILAGGAVPNAGDPLSATATWNNSTNTATVSVPWSWGTNPNGGKDSQSCWNGGKPENPEPGYNDVKGHWAVGLAISWNDSTTPYTLTGKAEDGSSVTLHVGNRMDAYDPNYCASTNAAAPYPHGTLTASHHYDNLAAFLAATNGGHLCANVYDVHRPNDAKEFDPSRNGDNTLENGHYAMTTLCPVASGISSPTPSPPSQPSHPSAPSTPAAPAGAAVASLSIIKNERDITLNQVDYVAGPITIAVGDRVGYEIVVTNTGNVALDVHLVDHGCVYETNAGNRGLDFSFKLNPGETSGKYHCFHIASAGDKPSYANTATANGVSASANAAPVAASVSAAPVSSSVVANVTGPSAVKAAQKTHTPAAPRKVVTHKAAKHVKKVTHVAKPAAPKAAAATFTG